MKSPGRLLLGVVVLTFYSIPEHARKQPRLAQMEEYEWTMNALERYRVLAADDEEEAALPEIDIAVEPRRSLRWCPAFDSLVKADRRPLGRRLFE